MHMPCKVLCCYLLFFSMRDFRRFVPKPSMIFVCPRSTASAPSGTSLVMVEPAPVYAALPILTGATRLVLQPIKALSPISVRNFFSPS